MFHQRAEQIQKDHVCQVWFFVQPSRRPKSRLIFKRGTSPLPCLIGRCHGRLQSCLGPVDRGIQQLRVGQTFCEPPNWSLDITVDVWLQGSVASWGKWLVVLVLLGEKCLCLKQHKTLFGRLGPVGTKNTIHEHCVHPEIGVCKEAWSLMQKHLHMNKFEQSGASLNRTSQNRRWVWVLGMNGLNTRVVNYYIALIV